MATGNLHRPDFVRAKAHAPRSGRGLKNRQEFSFYFDFLYFFSQAKEKISPFTQKYIIGAIFGEDRITAYFNNQPYHGPPLALSMVHNAILKSYMGESYGITVTNHPLPYQGEDKVRNDWFKREKRIKNLKLKNRQFFFTAVHIFQRFSKILIFLKMGQT